MFIFLLTAEVKLINKVTEGTFVVTARNVLQFCGGELLAGAKVSLTNFVFQRSAFVSIYQTDVTSFSEDELNGYVTTPTPTPTPNPNPNQSVRRYLYATITLPCNESQLEKNLLFFNTVFPH
jgi:hypothetical protein